MLPHQPKPAEKHHQSNPNEQTQTHGSSHDPPNPPGVNPKDQQTTGHHSKRSVTHQKDTPTKRPKTTNQKPRIKPQTINQPSNPFAVLTTNAQGAANVSLPSLFDFQRSLRFRRPRRTRGPSWEALSSRRPLACQRASRLVPHHATNSVSL
jgi:hypothetical protein